MPLIGLCLGFALASKWVALYAIGGIGILIFARSALGRLLIILGLIVDDRRPRPPRAGRPGRRPGSATSRSS